MSDERDVLRNTIINRLAELGWSAAKVSPGAPAVGTKEYQTAVGVKEAVAYFGESDGYNFKLGGDYQSEGNNCLSTSGVLIPVGADVGQVDKLVQQFVVQADRAVDQSYARRLYLKYDQPAEALAEEDPEVTDAPR